MGRVKFSDEFKQDVAAQITEWGYPLTVVQGRLDVSSHLLFIWRKRCSKITGAGPMIRPLISGV
jgi:transposase-like protein